MTGEGTCGTAVKGRTDTGLRTLVFTQLHKDRLVTAQPKSG